MSVMAELIRGQTIVDAFVDSEVTYLMLANGTQISISGLVLVQPDSARLRANFHPTVKIDGGGSVGNSPSS